MRQVGKLPVQLSVGGWKKLGFRGCEAVEVVNSVHDDQTYPGVDVAFQPLDQNGLLVKIAGGENSYALNLQWRAGGHLLQPLGGQGAVCVDVKHLEALFSTEERALESEGGLSGSCFPVNKRQLPGWEAAVEKLV